MKEYYYYFRDNNKRPMVTVCLLVDSKNKVWSRGIAVCSKQDNPCKKIGRGIAKQRAEHALIGKKDNSLMRDRVFSYFLGFYVLIYPFSFSCYKSQFKPNPLNDIEARILNKNNLFFLRKFNR